MVRYEASAISDAKLSCLRGNVVLAFDTLTDSPRLQIFFFPGNDFAFAVMYDLSSQNLFSMPSALFLAWLRILIGGKSVDEDISCWKLTVDMRKHFPNAMKTVLESLSCPKRCWKLFCSAWWKMTGKSINWVIWVDIVFGADDDARWCNVLGEPTRCRRWTKAAWAYRSPKQTHPFSYLLFAFSIASKLDSVESHKLKSKYNSPQSTHDVEL